MLSWVKEVLGHVKQRKESRSNSSVVRTISGGGEPECAKDCLHILEEELHVTNNNDHIHHLVLPTHPPPTPPSVPPSIHQSSSPPPSSATCLSDAPALQSSHVSPALSPCSQPPTPSSTQSSPPLSLPFQNTNAKGPSIPKLEMLLGSQQSLAVSDKYLSIDQENQREDTLQETTGNVLGPTIYETSYPSYFLTIALTNAIGQLVTVLGKKYVLVRAMGKILLVSLNDGSSNIPPCRVVWRASQPVPLVELPDSTFVEIDAVVCPESKKLHAAVIWQDTKPERCLQLLDDTYLFIDSRTVMCWPSSDDVLAKKLTVLGFDGTIISAEVCDAVVFIGQTKATLAELLQHNFEHCNATVYKVLKGTSGGQILYVCTCVWVGQKPATSSLPMVINREMLYAKQSHGFYTVTEGKVTFCLDVDASLCVSGDTATLQVELDGSQRLLKGTHPLDLESGCQEVGETMRVSVHINKENLGAFSAVMIKPSVSSVVGAILNEIPPFDPLSKTAPCFPSGYKDRPNVGNSASTKNNADDQQDGVSSSPKAKHEKVTQTSPLTHKGTQTTSTNLKMNPTPPPAPKVTPDSPNPLPAAGTIVDATCMMMKIFENSATLIVRSKFLTGNCGTAQARLCDMYDNLTPMTQTEAEKIRDKVWHCQLEIKNDGKQLMVPLAWRGIKPVNCVSSGSTVSQQPRQALSTGDLTSSSSQPSRNTALISQTPPPSPPKVLRGKVVEVQASGGVLRGEDGRVYVFSIKVCFLYGVCLHQVEPSEVLHIGMTVEFEVTERKRKKKKKKVVEAAVQRVWLEGEEASLAFPPTDAMIESWCSDKRVSSATRDALKKEAELLSPSLFPTALKMESITTVDITT